MYERFFGLRERPFDLVPNPRFLYLTGRQREALSNLRYGLTTPRGLTLLIGEAGTGKTTLVQAMLSEIDRADGRMRAAEQSDADPRRILRVPGRRLRAAGRVGRRQRRNSCSSCGATCSPSATAGMLSAPGPRRGAEPAVRTARGSAAAQQHRDIDGRSC